MISYEHKCVYVHIPKTGGTSIERLLWPNVHIHSTNARVLSGGLVTGFRNQLQTGSYRVLYAKNIRKLVPGWAFDDFFKFTFVRNPFDKFVSSYMYTKVVDAIPVQRSDSKFFFGPMGRGSLYDHVGVSPDVSFKGWVAAALEKPYAQWEPQWKFVLDDNGDNLLDFVGRFENLVEDFALIADKIGFKGYRFPHMNKSVGRGHYRDYYDDESRQMVEEFYKKDLEIFGYEF